MKRNSFMATSIQITESSFQEFIIKMEIFPQIFNSDTFKSRIDIVGFTPKVDRIFKECIGICIISLFSMHGATRSKQN